jgi:hypothetical protein
MATQPRCGLSVNARALLNIAPLPGDKGENLVLVEFSRAVRSGEWRFAR